MACEKVSGDYLEFGVYQGDSFIMSFYGICDAFRSRIKLDINSPLHETCVAERSRIWDNMRFFAFDSFQGLPQLSKADQSSTDFKAGMYQYEGSSFLRNLSLAGVNTNKVKTIPGWFKDTLTEKLLEEQQLKKAAIIWIDCDLYSSTREVLAFVTPLLQEGTILIFDDWFAYKGNPHKGGQKAFHEWIQSEHISQNYVLTQYQKEDWKRNSFIVSTLK